jgi:hypothetical protein
MIRKETVQLTGCAISMLALSPLQSFHMESTLLY